MHRHKGPGLRPACIKASNIKTTTTPSMQTLRDSRYRDHTLESLGGKSPMPSPLPPFNSGTGTLPYSGHSYNMPKSGPHCALITHFVHPAPRHDTQFCFRNIFSRCVRRILRDARCVRQTTTSLGLIERASQIVQQNPRPLLGSAYFLQRSERICCRGQALGLSLYFHLF